MRAYARNLAKNEDLGDRGLMHDFDYEQVSQRRGPSLSRETRS